jgi:hypothetical protein
MASDRYRRFCRALLEEMRGEVLHWVTIDSVADRLAMDPDKAAALAAELDDAGLVRVGGGHSVMLEEAALQALRRTLISGVIWCWFPSR